MKTGQPQAITPCYLRVEGSTERAQSLGVYGDGALISCLSMPRSGKENVAADWA
jgi:hypothetical protein